MAFIVAMTQFLYGCDRIGIKPGQVLNIGDIQIRYSMTNEWVVLRGRGDIERWSRLLMFS